MNEVWVRPKRLPSHSSVKQYWSGVGKRQFCFHRFLRLSEASGSIIPANTGFFTHNDDALIFSVRVAGMSSKDFCKETAHHFLSTERT